MIRVNLLTQRRVEATSEGSQTWLVILFAAMLAEGIVCVLLWQSKDAALTRQKQTNGELQRNIAKITETVKNHEEVKKQLAVFKQREDAINKLQRARSGPTSVLLELAHVLTQGRGPTVDAAVLAQLNRDNPLAVPNPSWDARRLWLVGFKEGDRVVMIEGLARDGEDVSELARRLSLSTYFSDVKLLPASREAQGSGAAKVEMVKFQLQAKAKY
ncbi:MAG: PilN domain-containing protein [Polyangiaceae bacterium]